MRARLLTVVLTTLVVIGSAVVAAPAAGAADLSCPADLANARPVAPKGATHPVVLVHGLNSSTDAFTKMKASLEQKLDSRYWVTTFSYASLASTWASHPGIAACLADYIHQVSGSAGGAKVFVVAHSMGGLAIRFATDTGRASNPVKPKELAGVVTIDTPTLGSPFGGVVGDPVIEAVTKPKKVPQVPGSPGDAIDCLAPHDPGHDLKMSCGTAPYLPDGVPLHQISGDIVLEQPLFGVVQHRDLRSDGIVGVESADGYARSGPSTDPAPSPTGRPFDRTCPTPVAGAAEFSAFTAAGFADLALLYAPAPQKVAALGVHAASVAALSVLAAQTSSCGHNPMLDSPDVAADVATTLQGWTPSDIAPAPAAPSSSEAALAAACTNQQMAACDQLWNRPPSNVKLRTTASGCGGAAEVGSSGYSGFEGICAKSFPTPTGPRRVVFGGWGVAVAGAALGAAAVVAGGGAVNPPTTTGSCLEVGIGAYHESDPNRSYVVLSAATQTILGVYAPADAKTATGLTAGATEADIRKAYAGDDITWLYGYQGSTWVLLVNAPGAPSAAIGFAFGSGPRYQQDQKPPPGTGYTRVVGGTRAAASGGELCSGG